MSFIKAKLDSYLRQFKVVLVTGARQAGKTTMLRQCLSGDYEYTTLDDLNELNLAISDPKAFLNAERSRFAASFSLILGATRPKNPILTPSCINDQCVFGAKGFDRCFHMAQAAFGMGFVGGVIMRTKHAMGVRCSDYANLEHVASSLKASENT